MSDNRAVEVTTGKREGLRNWRVEIPGSCVVAHLGRWDSRPCEWIYSLWAPDDDEDCETVIATGSLDVSPMAISPDQAARIAFLLDVEYAGR